MQLYKQQKNGQEQEEFDKRRESFLFLHHTATKLGSIVSGLSQFSLRLQKFKHSYELPPFFTLRGPDQLLHAIFILGPFSIEFGLEICSSSRWIISLFTAFFLCLVTPKFENENSTSHYTAAIPSGQTVRHEIANHKPCREIEKRKIKSCII